MKPNLQNASEWKPINGTNGKYWCSWDGRFYSATSGKYMEGSVANNGYRLVCLYLDGKAKTVISHRVIAEHWLPAPAEHQTNVRHIDGNKLNNHSENLLWISSSRSKEGWEEQKGVYVFEHIETGEIVKSEFAYRFQKQHSLPGGSFHRLINGVGKVCAGWRLLRIEGGFHGE